MKRICLVGSAGSGKTTLARKVGEITGIPVTSIDDLKFGKNWQRVAIDEVRRRLELRQEGDLEILDLPGEVRPLLSAVAWHVPNNLLLNADVDELEGRSHFFRNRWSGCENCITSSCGVSYTKSATWTRT